MTIGSLLRAIGGAVVTAVTAAIVTTAAKKGVKIANECIKKYASTQQQSND